MATMIIVKIILVGMNFNKNIKKLQNGKLGNLEKFFYCYKPLYQIHSDFLITIQGENLGEGNFVMFLGWRKEENPLLQGRCDYE